MFSRMNYHVECRPYVTVGVTWQLRFDWLNSQQSNWAWAALFIGQITLLARQRKLNVFNQILHNITDFYANMFSPLFTVQCGSNTKMVQGLVPYKFLYRSQPHLPSRQIFFEQSRKIVHPSSSNCWRRRTRSIRWKTEEMHQCEYHVIFRLFCLGYDESHFQNFLNV